MAGIILCLHTIARPLRALQVSVACMTALGCASNEHLFAEYDQHFCSAPGEGVPIVIEKIVEREVVRENIVVKEVPASATQLPWEPAVYFDSDCTRLNESSTEILSHNVSFLKKFPLYNVSVRGFTDQHASVEYNRRLSGKRTDKVVNYFAQQGISESRMIVHAHGESIALSDASSPVADEISRRVEMILLDQNGRPAVTFQNFALELE